MIRIVEHNRSFSCLEEELLSNRWLCWHSWKCYQDKVSQNYVFLAFLPYVRLKSQSYKSDTIWKRHCYLCRDATKFLGPKFNLNLNILLIKHHQNSLRSLCMMFNSSKYSNSRWILALTKISSCPNINSNVVSDSIGLILIGIVCPNYLLAL